MEKVLDNCQVVTMAYDLDTSNAPSINEEIKALLIERGWNFKMPEQKVSQIGFQVRIEREVDMPATTAWKGGITTSTAINDYVAACDAYNNKHAEDCPMHVAHGSVFVICNNKYQSMKFD